MTDLPPSPLRPEQPFTPAEPSLERKLRRQLAQGLLPIAVFTDIDGTYVYQHWPHQRHHSRSFTSYRRALRRVSSHYREATAKMNRYLAERNIPIIAVTGRDLASVMAGQEPDGEGLPLFDAIASDVGTQLWIYHDRDGYRPEASYVQMIEEKRGFRRDEVYPHCLSFLKEASLRFPTLQLELQPRDRPENVAAYASLSSEQARQVTGQPPPQPYKISYNFSASTKEASLLGRSFHSFLRQAGFPELRIIISHDCFLADGRTRFNIDVLPIGKDGAIDYLCSRYGCAGIVAGDSGNDADMLLRSDPRGVLAGIVVGGSKPELRHLVDRLEVVEETEDFSLVRTKEGTRLLYLEKGPFRGPDSMLRAVQALYKTLEKRPLPEPDLTTAQE